MKHFKQSKKFLAAKNRKFSIVSKKSQKGQSLIVVLLGPPGAGKGTQAELVSEKLNLYYLETSKVLEEKFRDAKEDEYIAIKGTKYFISKEIELWKTGKLCDPPFVAYLVKDKIKKLSKLDKNLVFAGSPRTLYEGKEIIPFLKKIYGAENIKVIFIKILPEQTLWRNSRRRICELMRHPILYTEETAALTRCPLDGSKLLKRTGLDDPETIKVRLKEYGERTIPLLNYFKEENLGIKEVNGDQSVEGVFKEILKYLS